MTIWKRLKRRRKLRMRTLSPFLSYFIDAETLDINLRVGSKIYNPPIDSENDAVVHLNYLSEFSVIQQLPIPLNGFFVQPMDKYKLGKTNTLIFEPFRMVSTSIGERTNLITDCYVAIVQTGRSDIYSKFLFDKKRYTFVGTDFGFKILWLPKTLPDSTNITDESILNIEHIIVNRNKHNTFSIELLQNTLNATANLIEWPSERELKEYSIERLQIGNQTCHPVKKGSREIVYNESDHDTADAFIRVWDTLTTYRDVQFEKNIFSNYIVYLRLTEDNLLVPDICIASVEFVDIGSKHAHLVLSALPEHFFYLFSGELIRESSGNVLYNLTSGMFYYMQLESNRRNDLSLFDLQQQTEEQEVITSYLCKEAFNWESFSQIVLSTLLNEQVFFVSNLRPYISLTNDALSIYCNHEGFSLREYGNLNHCTGKGFGRNKCFKM